MTRILLVRHATTELQGKVLYGRMPGVHLSVEGYAQTERLAEGLHANYRIGKIISSPLERATETAQKIAERNNLAVAIDDRLNELNHGDWVGKTFDQLRQLQQWDVFNESRSTSSAPGGESLLSVQARAWAAIDELRMSAEDETIALVTHGDVIRSLLVLFLGMSLDNILRLEVLPASVCEVSLYPRGVILHNMNRIFN